MKRGFRARKKGQMKMSFGMIFSIILIIIFLAFSFYAITKFLDLQKGIQTGKFAGDFQNDINNIWKGSLATQSEEYLLPSGINYVCFAKIPGSASGPKSNIYDELKFMQLNGDENMFFYPAGSSQGINAVSIKNIDISKITASENPYCIPNAKGKLELVIKKNFGDAQVTIER